MDSLNEQIDRDNYTLRWLLLIEASNLFFPARDHVINLKKRSDFTVNITVDLDLHPDILPINLDIF